MKVAFQMDPIGSVDINADSTFRLAEEAQARGCTLWHYTPRLPVLPRRARRRPGAASDGATRQGQSRESGRDRRSGPWRYRCRLAAPGPALRYGLHHDDPHSGPAQGPNARRSNDPFWVRNSPEKAPGPRFSPISRRPRPSRGTSAFCGTSRPNMATSSSSRFNGNGGAGVFRLDPNDRNLASLHRAVHLHESRAADRAEIPSGRRRGRQADHPRRRGSQRAPINRVPAPGETPVEHACRRAPGKGRTDPAGAGDLRRHRPRACARWGRSSWVST